MTEHVSDDLELYALGAMTSEDAERIATHLALCPACREEARSLAEVVGTLPDTVPLRAPRDTLRERILGAARADLLAPHRPGFRPPAFRLGRVRAWPLAITGLACAALLLGIVDLDASRRLAQTAAERERLFAIAESVSEGGRWWYMAGKEELAGSGGTLIVPRAEGHGPFVLFHDLPRLSRDRLLTVWLVSSDSTWVRAATFRPNGQDLQAVEVTVPVAGFDRCAVTVETAWTGPHKGTVVMESRIAAPALPN